MWHVLVAFPRDWLPLEKEAEIVGHEEAKCGLIVIGILENKVAAYFQGQASDVDKRKGNQ